MNRFVDFLCEKPRKKSLRYSWWSNNIFIEKSEEQSIISPTISFGQVFSWLFRGKITELIYSKDVAEIIDLLRGYFWGGNWRVIFYKTSKNIISTHHKNSKKKLFYIYDQTNAVICPRLPLAESERGESGRIRSFSSFHWRAEFLNAGVKSTMKPFRKKQISSAEFHEVCRIPLSPESDPAENAFLGPWPCLPSVV